MATVYLSIGSNVGYRLKNISSAIKLLTKFATIEKLSCVYESSPVGYIDQPNFYNCVVKIFTDLSPSKLLKQLKKIEKLLGRKKTFRWGPRIIDIDILLYDNLVLKTKKLTIPHKELLNRKFVLLPLKEIEPEIVHPELNLPIRFLLKKYNFVGQKIRKLKHKLTF